MTQPARTPPLVPPFRVGQVWAYQTRPSEPKSRLTIVRIDEDPRQGTIVHVRVTGLHVRNSKAESGVATEMAHLPFAAQALSESVTGKISDYGPLGDFQEGYELWRREFDAGKGGIWALGVAETVEALEEMLRG